MAIRATFSLLLFCFQALAFANTLVVELSANEVLSFVAKHPSAVVQLNSGDPRCGYCVGADKLFDEIAAKPYSKPVVFARVQWALWKDFPKFEPAIKVFGMPSMLFFKHGVQIDLLEGRYKEPAEMADIHEAVELFASSTANPADPSKVLASAHVVELKPAQLLAYLATNPWAVVQFISSDVNCSFCLGAAYSFNSAARFRVDKNVPFARVQWPSPWRNIPVYANGILIDGIPAVKVFHEGKVVTEVTGKPRDRNDVFRVMNAGFDKVRASTAP